MNTITNIQQTLRWSEPQQVRTRNGDRILRTATPTPAFWGAWRSNKPALQQAGLTCRPAEDGAWVVCWWSDPTEPVVVPTTVLPVASDDIPRQTKDGRLWSDEQMAIFGWFKSGTGSLVVRARAGTGKTTTIKQAFSYAPEQRMLYAVFNKKNQREAQQAITDPRVEVKTLHALGFVYILGVWPKSKPDNTVEDDRVSRAAGENAPQEVRNAIRKLVGFAKNMLVSPTVSDLVRLALERDTFVEGYEDPDNGGWTVEKLAATALEAIHFAKERDPEMRISFDDMVWLPVAMGWVRAWYDLVVVDEAQDMNLPQLLMAKGACRRSGRVCVVGDDRQAIYGFRGACQDGMDMMLRTLEARELGLTITYRCPKTVVALAAQIVPDYKAADAAPEGTVQNISEGVLVQSVAVGDAILSRTNAPLMGVCLSLLRKGVSARIEGRDIGKALVGIVEKLHARTVPHFLTKIRIWGSKQKNRFRSLKDPEPKYAEIDDQVETLVAVAEGASSVKEITSRLSSLFADTTEGSLPAVVLSSVHKAKGLEWDRVFILAETFRRASTGGEEANIYYVAVTRAKNTLIMVHQDRQG